MWPRRPRELAPVPRPPAAAAPGLFRRLQWTVLRPLGAHFGGEERSLLHGPGMELTEVREYQAGDDVRRIDWNVSARTDQIYVRESIAERGIDAWFIVDVSPSLAWGTADCLKGERAVDFLAAASQIVGAHGNRLAAILFDDRPLAVLPPTGGRQQVVRLISRVREERGRGGHSTDLAGALDYAMRIIRRRSLVIVVSDFLTPEGWAAPLRRLAARHETVAVRLTDPREGALPAVGLLTLEDPESGQQLVVNTGDCGVRERFAAAATAQSEAIRATLAGAGVDLLTLGTDRELLPALVGFLEARRHRRRVRGVAAQPAVARLP